MNAEAPKFVLKYWVKERKDFGPPTLKHAVFYNEETLIEFIRNIHRNYFVFETGKPYKSKDEFDKMFADEKLEKERQDFERLKQKFEKDGNNN